MFENQNFKKRFLIATIVLISASLFLGIFVILFEIVPENYSCKEPLSVFVFKWIIDKDFSWSKTIVGIVAAIILYLTTLFANIIGLREIKSKTDKYKNFIKGLKKNYPKEINKKLFL